MYLICSDLKSYLLTVSKVRTVRLRFIGVKHGSCLLYQLVLFKLIVVILRQNAVSASLQRMGSWSQL